MKGRKGDEPGLQSAKGNPGKRQSKEEKRIAEAQRMADLLAVAEGSEGDPLAPPRFLDQRFAPALAVWKEYAPRLKHLNMLDPLFRHVFAMFCVWTGEFVVANEEILEKGYSVMVRTVSGDKMPRENPAVGRRETAQRFVMQLSEKFGFTPLDQHKLIREMGANFGKGSGGGAGRDLFEQGGDGATPSASDAAVGAMNNMDSPPPKPH